MRVSEDSLSEKVLLDLIGSPPAPEQRQKLGGLEAVQQGPEPPGGWEAGWLL